MTRFVPTRGRRPGAALARLAGMFSQQESFLRFSGTHTPEQAAQWVRDQCGVSSRAELDHSPAAAKRFHDRVRRPYAAYMGADQ
ncbi:hypothetical protein [Kerstersia gyiorum]|uniref:Uncharacterized protein n=1 Tax=Kerstersia gyiorum TaxID=206506 RepID=A0A171KSF7_9BURK|nr:hypothetical protein [Kerstersia gyiorum]KKO71824.1 hypothetical protein AAV32_09615 [Kerstersia gyiorum]